MKVFKSFCKYALVLLSASFTSCSKKERAHSIITGADQLEIYVPLLQGKKIALVANQTSCIGKEHLADVLLSKGILLKKIFAPEHGFRGDKDANEQFSNTTDPKTGLPIVSLHGSSKKFAQAMLEDIDLVVFDMQDVGVRCYTYISALHDTMEACALNNIPLIVLDRPNPNGHYVDGPVLNLKFKSYVGKHPIPLVYGLTIGELAQMINGEKWLKDQLKCDLKVIPLKNYTHQSHYSLPINASPNLPNDQSISLYPTLVLFEGTTISVGRGTPFPFQVIGYPHTSCGNFQFTPVNTPGKDKRPKYQDKLCYGIDLRDTPRTDLINLKYLISFYKIVTDQGLKFFEGTFDIHAGSDLLRKQLKAGLAEEDIRASWQKDLDAYNVLRKKYLIYN